MVDNTSIIKNKRLIWVALVHAALLCCALILTYDSYKEIVSHLYDKYYLPKDQREEIKNAFPYAIIIFLVLYLFYSIWHNKEKGFLSAAEYGRLFILQAVITNLMFFSKGHHVLIVLNSSFLYLSIFLFVSVKISGTITGIIPDTIDKRLIHTSSSNLTSLILWSYTYIRERPSAPFILTFAATLPVATFILMTESTKKADPIATVAFFALFIGVGIETHRLFTCGSGNEK